MMILDYLSTDHSYLATTNEGEQELILFQVYFYIRNRKFQNLQDAIFSCRRDIDYGAAISIVVCHDDYNEVWLRLTWPVQQIVQKPWPAPSQAHQRQQPVLAAC